VLHEFVVWVDLADSSPVIQPGEMFQILFMSASLSFIVQHHRHHLSTQFSYCHCYSKLYSSSKDSEHFVKRKNARLRKPMLSVLMSKTHLNICLLTRLARPVQKLPSLVRSSLQHLTQRSITRKVSLESSE